MLGREFQRSLSAESFGAFTRANLDLESSVDDLAGQLEGYDVILNCTAYTAVDLAETHEDEANHVNGELVAKLGAVAKVVGAKLIHYSTDYVFDGENRANGQPYQTTTPRNPQNAYGRSKALGERLLEDSGSDFTIIRTAWLYGEFGKCFPKTIANLLESRDSIKVVSDQLGQPTWTRDLAEYTLRFLTVGASETHLHGVASGSGTWFDFASEVALALGKNPGETVFPVKSSEFPTPAKRPAFSVLDNRTDGIVPIGDWRDRWHEAASQILAAR